MALSIYDPSTMLVLGGLVFIFISFVKVDRDHSGKITVEIREGSKKHLFLFGIVFIVIGIASSTYNSKSTKENSPIIINNNNNLTQTTISGQTSNTSTASASTPVETTTSTSEPTEISTTKHIATPYQFEVSPYLDWNFTTSRYSIYSANLDGTLRLDGTPPDGYIFVIATIHINNDGDKPISTDPSCWKFVTDGMTYSYNTYLQLAYTASKQVINPGEEYTFYVYYLVKGNPEIGTLEYENPFIET